MKHIIHPNALTATDFSKRAAKSNNLASSPDPPNKVIENGICFPSSKSYVPAGIATAQRSSTFPKCAKVPKSELSEIGSFRTSSMVKWLGVVGTTRMSIPDAWKGLKIVSWTVRVRLQDSY